MLSVALLSLILPVVAPAAGPATRADATLDPAVRVSLDHRTYVAGDRARVTVRAREDGYLLVLHVDPDGRVRVFDGRVESWMVAPLNDTPAAASEMRRRLGF